MKRLLMTGPACTKCGCCEEWLPGFVSIYGGRLVVAEWWSHDALEDICHARACCPKECIIYRELRP